MAARRFPVVIRNARCRFWSSLFCGLDRLETLFLSKEMTSMETLAEEDKPAAIRRKVYSSGKKRNRTPSICHRNMSAKPCSEEVKQAQGQNEWIANSFLKNSRYSMAESNNQSRNSNDESDLLNSSDLLMAQIDLDVLTEGNLCPSTSSPKMKRLCSISNKKVSKLKDSTNTMSNHSSLILNQLQQTNQSNSSFNKTNVQDSSSNKKCFDSKIECSFNADQDLFEDNINDFDEIFFLHNEFQSEEEPCEMNKPRAQRNMSDAGDGVASFGEEESGLCPYKDENHVISGDIGRNLQNANGVVQLLVNEDGHSSCHLTTEQQIGDVIQPETLTLKEKLKLRLQKNVSSPRSDICLESKLKEEALSKARLDASQIRREGCSADIGPFYGLPSKVKDLFESVKGISKLYDWQDECLRLPAVRDRKNLIYTLPTSGGKTLVAEILILRELLCYQRDVLLILPFVSIVQEKVRGMTEFATSLEFLVEEYAGSRGRFPPMKRKKKKSLFMATIEKGHALVNSLIETERMDSLGLVVVDELHMLGEGGSRGATLESCLLKILHSKVDTQVIGMSATLNNLPDVQKFLQAEIYTNNFRPVLLEEYVKVEDNLFSVQPKALCMDEQLEHCRVTLFPYSSEVLKRDPDHLLGLVLEVIPDNSCLVFCPTKKNCENVALMLSELMCQHRRHLTQVNKEARRLLLQELYRAGDRQLCPTLSYTIHFGIAYHHSGLTMDERRLIEEAYAQGILCLLTCTSTLAAGVNLPAKRVILRSPYVGQEFIKYSQYKQMTGRAGRAGLDASGESILITKKQDKLLVKELLAGPKDFCHSSLLFDGGQGIQGLLLSSIGLRLVTTTESAFQLLDNSLLHIQRASLGVDVVGECQSALQLLLNEGLVVQGSKPGKWPGEDNNVSDKRPACLDVTALGKATFKGCVNHRYSNQLYKDLRAAEDSLVVSNHFHLLYLVTPYDMAAAVTPVWGVYYKRFCQLSETEHRVATVVGISENYLSRKSVGLSTRQKVATMPTNRFYLSLMLWDLWNGRTVWDVAHRFVQSRGFVQNLLSSAASFASCVYHFCQELEEFWAYRDLLGNLVKRLSYCVTSELIPLMEVPGVLIARAKQLYSAGVRSLADLAAADADDLSRRIENLSKRNARQIVSAAKNLVEEKTAVLMEEVESLVSVTGNLT